MTRPHIRQLAGHFRPLDRGLATVALAAAALVLLAAQGDAMTSLRERLFDAVSGLGRSRLAGHWPVIVDIDRETLASVGSWPWSRDRIAALVTATAAARPKAIALDILLEGPDQRSPAALARRLAVLTGEASLGALSDRLDDGDRLLAAAIAKVPTVLGTALDPQAGRTVEAIRPILVGGTFDARGLWPAAGLVAPEQQLAEAAAGLGSLALAGDSDGSVRRVPLLALVDGRLVPSLALELVRVTAGQSLHVLDGAQRTFKVADRAIAVGRDGLMRLIPRQRGDRTQKRLSAARVLDHDPEALALLGGAVVVIGGSAPELGGLRPQADGTLAPSSDLQATAYAQLATGVLPWRSGAFAWIEGLATFAFSGLAAWLARRATPLNGLLIVSVAAIAWISLGLGLGAVSLALVDLIAPPLAAAGSFAISSLLVEADSRWRAQRIRERFEQHLAPAVVRRIADDPDALRLAGELREVTALFTDIEGFTPMTSRATPTQLIELLDGYFDGLSRIVVAHDGLVDKMIGDAVHALFNAPFDLAEHPRQALACAIAMQRFADEYRQTPIARTLQLGRTRVGLETGSVIVGDVGGARKLDYTAHGTAVNAAARLEQANKLTGTSILVGPTAAASIGTDSLMPLGRIAIRGLDGMREIYTPWPADYDDALRRRVRSAVDLGATNLPASRDAAAAIAASRPGDEVLARLASRLAEIAAAGA